MPWKEVVKEDDWGNTHTEEYFEDSRGRVISGARRIQHTRDGDSYSPITETRTVDERGFFVD